MAKEILILEATAEVGNESQFTHIINTTTKQAFLGKQLGLTAEQIGQLKQIGKLETTLQKEWSHLTLPRQASIELFAEARKFLKLHKGYMPEHRVRELIHQIGLPTFPRPVGISQNYRVKLYRRGAGIKYVHPTNKNIEIRVMSRKAHDGFLHRRKPYVMYRKNGKFFDQYGKLAEKEKL